MAEDTGYFGHRTQSINQAGTELEASSLLAGYVSQHWKALGKVTHP